MEKDLFGDTAMMPDVQKAGAMIELYKDFAGRFPDDSLSPELLFKAADIASGFNREREAISMFEQIEKRYPDSRKASISLFMEGFVYENRLRDNVQAEAKYEEFLRRYPQHQLASSAKASLEQLRLGLTTEDLIRLFEAKNDSLEKQGKAMNDR